MADETDPNGNVEEPSENATQQEAGDASSAAEPDETVPNAAGTQDGGDAEREDAGGDRGPGVTGEPDADADVDGPTAGPTDDTEYDTDVETTYEATATGHRVIRRTVKRKRTTEEVEEDVIETITEDLPTVYEAPRSPHPAPVG